MNAAVKTLQRQLSNRTFRVGIGVVSAAYLLLFGYLWSTGGSDTAYTPASQTVAIEREVVAVPFGPPQPEVTTEAHEEEPQHEAAPVVTATTTSSDSVALAPAPIDGVYEDSLDGKLPKIRTKDGLTPFNAYRRPFAAKAGTPTIAIGVIDYGLSETASKATLSDLSPDVSLILSPYSNTVDYWVKEGRDHGHEIWMALPVEGDLYPRDDSGPQTLLIGGLEKINLKKLTWTLTRTQGYAGLATLHDTSFMKSAIDAKPVMNEIYSRGLAFIDGDTEPSDTPLNIANEENAPYGRVDVWIDIPATPEHMAASLRQLEVLAQANGSATGFISATPTGLKTLQTWIDGLPQKNLMIAPLSAQTQKAK